MASHTLMKRRQFVAAAGTFESPNTQETNHHAGQTKAVRGLQDQQRSLVPIA
ncbi:MAG: hypothetical protein ABI702_20220 [Burkholderiales bacterium]